MKEGSSGKFDNVHSVYFLSRFPLSHRAMRIKLISEIFGYTYGLYHPSYQIIRLLFFSLLAFPSAGSIGA